MLNVLSENALQTTLTVITKLIPNSALYYYSNHFKQYLMPLGNSFRIRNVFFPNFKIKYQIFCQMYITINCHKQQNNRTNKHKQKVHLKVTKFFGQSEMFLQAFQPACLCLYIKSFFSLSLYMKQHKN